MQRLRPRIIGSADSIRQVLLYVVVISLIFSASERSAKRASIRRLLIAGSALFAALSLYFTYNHGLDLWMTQFSRNVGFLAVILNLILWAALLKHRRPDQTLLLVSGGMGIQMAGKAIGHSLRQLRITVTAGDLVIVLSHLLCLYIWWQAFRKPSKSRLRFRSNRPGAAWQIQRRNRLSYPERRLSTHPCRTGPSACRATRP